MAIYNKFLEVPQNISSFARRKAIIYEFFLKSISIGNGGLGDVGGDLVVEGMLGGSLVRNLKKLKKTRRREENRRV